MGPTALGRTWDVASSPAVESLARRFEAAWRASPGSPPNPADFLGNEVAERSGALLALLRIDIVERRRRRSDLRMEWYRDRFPELGTEGLVALLYEDFCLREEAGEEPDPADYESRFPE